jgi:NAD(P)-dependent dehydrogenase (short-subunit alcohol dehydrogenase family)
MKTAVISGSSSGLGYNMALSLLEKGYTVFGGSRSGSDIEHESFYDVELDVREEESVQEFYEAVLEYTDKIDLVVVNAGICEMESSDNSSADFFSNHIQTNTVGAFLFLKYAKPHLIPKESHVISVLSTAAKFAYPNVSAYNASKFGMLGMIESLKKEWKELNLRFTNLFPGSINTELWDKLDARFSREKMLTSEEFISVFDFVVLSSDKIQFSDITFLHKDGFLE